MNPILQNNKVGQILPIVGQVKQMMGMVQAASDPMGALNQMSSNDPRMKAVMDMVKGKNPEQVFYDKCKEMGVNPDMILGMLR